MLFPLLLILICFIFLMLATYEIISPGRFKNWLSARKISIVSTLLVFLVYLSQNVLEAAFSIFECKNLYRLDSPDYYLVSAPDISCWTSQHYKWCFGVALPVILLWGIAIPVTLNYIIYKNKTILETQEFQMKFSFIVRGYKQTFPAITWEAF